MGASFDGICAEINGGNLRSLHVLADYLEDQGDPRSSYLRRWASHQPEQTTIVHAVPIDEQRRSVRHVEATAYFWTKRTVGDLFDFLHNDFALPDLPQNRPWSQMPQDIMPRRYYLSLAEAYLDVAAAEVEMATMRKVSVPQEVMDLDGMTQVVHREEWVRK